MSGGKKSPVTQAARVLRAAGIEFEDHPYTYVDGGGTAQFLSLIHISEPTRPEFV